MQKKTLQSLTRVSNPINSSAGRGTIFISQRTAAAAHHKSIINIIYSCYFCSGSNEIMIYFVCNFGFPMAAANSSVILIGRREADDGNNNNKKKQKIYALLGGEIRNCDARCRLTNAFFLLIFCTNSNRTRVPQNQKL